MKDEWFGDHLDLAKWGILHRLAVQHGFKQVDHIAFFSESKRPMIIIDEHGAETIAQVVWETFRDWKRLEQGAFGDVSVRIFDHEWPGGDRAAYVRDAHEWLNQINESRVVLLDPDTGIEPRCRGSSRHLKVTEVRQFWDGLARGNVLAIYQHAPRGVAMWEEAGRIRLAETLRLDSSEVRIGRTEKPNPQAVIYWMRKC